MTRPNWVTCPGETLAEWIEYTGIPDSCFWVVWRIPETILNNVLAGAEPVTPEIAEQLERVTFIPARFWLALEHNYRAGLNAGCTHTPHETRERPDTARDTSEKGGDL